MRAVVLRDYGTEEGLHFIKHHTQPVIQHDDEVLVKIKACALGDLDLAVRRGGLPEIVHIPAVIGYEISGVVTEIGSEVKRFDIGDEVVGILPADTEFGGYAEFCVVSTHVLVKKPLTVSHEDAAACLVGGTRAYTAFHYLMNLVAGETVLILNGASAFGHLAIQLAGHLGFRVLTTASTPEEFNYLNDLNTDIVRIIDPLREDLFAAVVEETGGVGVEGILADCTATSDAGANGDGPSVTASGGDNDSGVRASISQHEIIRCLAVHGRWVSADPSLQLDPPEARMLYFKGATLSFLFEQSWLLSMTQQGRYLHFMNDLMEKVSTEAIRPRVARTFPLEKIREAHRTLENTFVGRIVIKP